MTNSRKSNEVFSGGEVPVGLQQHMNAIAEMSGGDPQQHKSASPVQTSQQSESIATMLARDFGFEIPNETVPLPSKGLVYSVDHPFYNQQYVDIKAMTSREEDILTSQALLKKGTVVTELIRSCLCNKDVNSLDLIVGDRNALMVAIRVTGYGAKYDGEVVCDSCKEKSAREFDLSQLEIKGLKIQPVSEGVNEFEYKLPKLNVPLRFRFLTGRDEEDMARTSEMQKKKMGISQDASVTTFLRYSIVSVNGVTDRSKIAQFVTYLPAKDSSALRRYISDNSPGVIMKQESVCPLCNHVEEVAIPIGVTFLWPNAE